MIISDLFLALFLPRAKTSLVSHGNVHSGCRSQVILLTSGCSMVGMQSDFSSPIRKKKLRNLQPICRVSPHPNGVENEEPLMRQETG